VLNKGCRLDLIARLPDLSKNLVLKVNNFTVAELVNESWRHRFEA